MTKRKIKPSPICRVAWTDASMSAADHWQDGSTPKRPDKKSHLCVSVGYLTHCDQHFVQITQTLTAGQHAHVLNVPRAMVETIEVLAPAGPLEGA